MSNNNTKTHALAAMVLASVLLASVAWAEAAPDLSKQADISFGTIDFEGTTGSGNIVMGSNGSIIYGNNTSGTGYGTPAQILITGEPGTTVSISCSTEGSMVLPGHPALQLTPVRFAIGTTNIGTYANDTECAGVGIGSALHTISATPADNTIFIGGSFHVDGQPLVSGMYSTGNGGTLPQFQILVQ